MNALLLLALVAADAPLPSAETIRVHDLSTLTVEEARELEGKRAVFRLETVLLRGENQMRASWLCKSRDKVIRKVWIWKPHADKKVMLVEAAFQLVRIQAEKGEPEIVEFWLNDARQLR